MILILVKRQHQAFSLSKNFGTNLSLFSETDWSDKQQKNHRHAIHNIRCQVEVDHKTIEPSVNPDLFDYCCESKVEDEIKDEEPKTE